MKQKIVILYMMQHAPSPVQIDNAAKLQILYELGLTYIDQTFEELDELFEVEFTPIKSCHSEGYLKNIPPDATTRSIESSVRSIIEHQINPMMEKKSQQVVFWYEGPSIVAVMFDRHLETLKIKQLKAHAERVSQDLPNGEKKSSFVHKKFLVY